MADTIQKIWQPIKDLPSNWQALQSEELKGLASVWLEQTAVLKDAAVVARFNEALKREWAIETGILEGLYQLDRGVTEILIQKGIEAEHIPFGATNRPPEEVAAIVKDQESTLDWVFDFVASRRPLTSSFIKELHSLLTRHQHTVPGKDQFGALHNLPLLHGKYKEQPNNPSRQNGTSFQYCPPEQTESEMDLLIRMHQQHEPMGVGPELEAAWLHHRFTQIHPFQDGNGRVARALASLIFIKARWFPLVINRNDRNAYITALEKADGGDLDSLAGFFVRVEKRAFVRALSLAEEVRRDADPLQDLIAAAAERMKDREKSRRQDWTKVFALAEVLRKDTTGVLTGVEERLNREFLPLDKRFKAQVDSSVEDNEFYFKGQIVETAKKLDYFADTRSLRAWTRMTIRDDRKTNLVFSFHSLGTVFSGVLAVSAFVEFRDRKTAQEDDAAQVQEPHPVCEEVFQFAYNEKHEAVRHRYAKWLNASVLFALEEWRRQI